MARAEVEALAATPPNDELVAPGTTLRADRSFEWVGERLVAGGSPWRLFHLTEQGCASLESWTRGTPVSDVASERALARRFVDAGLLHPSLRARAPGPGEVDLVVPVRDASEGLEALLAVLDLAPAVRVTVVDDGSLDADQVERVVSAHAATLVRLDVPGGPGAARNAGLAATTAPLVAFLDADARPEHDWLDELIVHFADERVAAVAPRVRGPQAVGVRERFETVASPLDLGDQPGVVRPGAAIPFVPSAALVVRRSAVGVPFDEVLRVGEDVDLVWRLAAQGWLVRYEPSVVVTHEARTTWRGWVSQRFAYGMSASALEARHGDAAAPLRADPRVLLTLALALAGRPRAALGVLSWSATSLSRQLDGIAGRAGNESAARQIAARGTALAAPGLARSAFRTYGPVLVVAAAAVSPIRRPVAALAATATAVRWWRAGRPSQPITFAAMSIADDLAYGAGVMAGAVRSRRTGALRPRLRAASTVVPRLSRT